MVKFSPTALNFGYNFVLLVHFFEDTLYVYVRVVYCHHHCSSTSSSSSSSSQDTYRTLGVWLRFLSPIQLKLDFPTDIEVISRFPCNQRRTLKPDDPENKKVSPNGKQKCVSHLMEGEYFRVLIVRLPSSECWGTMLSFYFEEKLLFSGKHFILREKFYFEEKLSYWGKKYYNSWCILKVWRMNSKSEKRLAFSERNEK